MIERCFACGEKFIYIEMWHLYKCNNCRTVVTKELLEDWSLYVEKNPSKFARFFTSREPERRKDPIISWRCWEITPAGLLASLVAKGADGKVFTWETPVTTVRRMPNGQLKRIHMHNKGISLVDDPGIYSYKSPFLLSMFMDGLCTYPIYGRMENYGHIVEHFYGLRAQKVVIQELWVNAMVMRNLVPVEVHIPTLEHTYDCRVSVIRDLDDYNNWIDEETEKWERKILP